MIYGQGYDPDQSARNPAHLCEREGTGIIINVRWKPLRQNPGIISKRS